MNRVLITLTILLISAAACTSAPQAAAEPDLTPTLNPVLPTDPASAAPTLPAATAPAAEFSPAATTLNFEIVPEESRVTYEVGETFFNQNNRFNLAVGITQTLSGTVFADLSNPPTSRIGPVQVDISRFTSDSSRRDNAIRERWLESASYPMAVFESTQIEGLPDTYVEGQDYTLKVTGNLTVREVTRQVTFDVVTRLAGNTLSGRAETTILLSDFNVGPISIAGVLKTEDQARIILEFVARSE